MIITGRLLDVSMVAAVAVAAGVVVLFAECKGIVVDVVADAPCNSTAVAAFRCKFDVLCTVVNTPLLVADDVFAVPLPGEGPPALLAESEARVFPRRKCNEEWDSRDHDENMGAGGRKDDAEDRDNSGSFPIDEYSSLLDGSGRDGAKSR